MGDFESFYPEAPNVLPRLFARLGAGGTTPPELIQTVVKTADSIRRHPFREWWLVGTKTRVGIDGR